MKSEKAFPLCWPPGWPRTESANRKKAGFFRKGQTFNRPLSLDETTKDVLLELRRLKAEQVVISTNVELRNDGLPRGDRPRPQDVGAAVYFTLKGKPQVLAGDKWNRVEDNLSAIARHIEALRAQERWGIGTIERAFTGYLALPPAGSSPGTSWWNLLGLEGPGTIEQARDAYRGKAMAAHPDNGGSNDLMVALNAAWDQARQHFGR